MIGLLAGAAMLAGAVDALAQQSTVYTWTGRSTSFEGRCPTYEMTIDVTVTGREVKGWFQQKGRPERGFVATLDNAGAYKSTAVVGGGNTMDVSGSVSGDTGKVQLRGYCDFGGDMKKK